MILVNIEMFNFFPRLYEDELFYSIMSRYHRMSGSKNVRNSILELTGDRNARPSVFIPSHLEYTASEIRIKKINSEYLIQRHTLLPLFTPFMTKVRRTKLLTQIRFSNGVGVYNQLGLSASKIKQNFGIRYCPSCAAEDLNKYGELYLHRLHNIANIEVCYKHWCELIRISDSIYNSKKFKYIKFDESLIVKPQYINRVHTPELTIVSYFEFLLSHDLNYFDYEIVRRKCIGMLEKKFLVTLNKHFRKKNIINELIQFYGTEFLQARNVFLNPNKQTNWLDYFLHSRKVLIHPYQIILLINYLEQDPSVFFNKVDTDVKPFGNSPWPCLNIASDHYKELLITKVEISRGKSKQQIIGRFSCSCGFTYVRNGPDNNPSDKFRYSRVINYGDIWIKKAKELYNVKGLSFREISRRLQCDAGTVIKYIRAEVYEHQITIFNDVIENQLKKKNI